MRHGRLPEAPERALSSQLHRGVWHVLIQWAGLPETDATWEQVDEFHAAYPDFQLEDELFVDGGSDVMVGRVYQRGKRSCG
jgi:hypothetical protein